MADVSQDLNNYNVRATNMRIDHPMSTVMDEQGFPQDGESHQDFYIRMVTEGILD